MGPTQVLDAHSLGQLARIPYLDPVVADGQRQAAIDRPVIPVDQGIHDKGNDVAELWQRRAGKLP